MKKHFSILLILVLSVGLVPVDSSLAITQNQIDSTVFLVCPDDYGNWLSGSGTIISESGIIMTNNHVVTSPINGIIPYCIVALPNGVNSLANLDNLYIAETKHYSTADDLDVAILYVVDEDRKFEYFNIFNSNSQKLNINDTIEALGYPSYNDSKLTHTMGNFKGNDSGFLNNYFEASTFINSGNSGGGAYNSFDFMGIPTLKITSVTGVKYFFLTINSIKEWLNEKLGTNYETRILEYEPIEEKPNIILPPDYYPPHYNKTGVGLNQYNLDNELKNHSYLMESTVIYEFPRISFEWDQDCFGETRQIQRDVCIIDDESAIEGYYYYFGSDPTAIPITDGEYISAASMSRESYYKNQGNNNFPYTVKLPVIFEAKKGKNYFILQAKDKNGNISDSLINIEYIYEVDNFKDIKSFDIKDYSNRTIGNIRYPNNNEIPVCESFDFCLTRELDYTNTTIYTNQNSLYFYPDFGYDIDGLVYYISYGDDRFWHDKIRTGTVTSNEYIKISNISSNKITNIFLKPNAQSLNEFFGKHLVLQVEYSNVLSNIIVPSQTPENFGRLVFTYVDEDLISRLKGHILLQVENNGEAWYLDPTSSKRYYMKDGAVAYEALRKFGLGITDSDLAKIPEEGGSSVGDRTLVERLKGRILLQVEQHGEAWYVHPETGKRHYMKDGEAAYQIMRFLSLGITNSDLNKIPTGSL